jgi:hypothetical protein
MQRNISCIEELDCYTKINELIQKYPRLDTEWQAEKQVA